MYCRRWFDPPGGGGNPQSGGGRPSDDAQAPTLTVRWESALPVREAELKAHSTGNPEVDDEHYGIAVYGLPGRMTNGNSKTMADALKREASIQR